MSLLVEQPLDRDRDPGARRPRVLATREAEQQCRDAHPATHAASIGAGCRRLGRWAPRRWPCVGIARVWPGPGHAADRRRAGNEASPCHTAGGTMLSARPLLWERAVPRFVMGEVERNSPPRPRRRTAAPARLGAGARRARHCLGIALAQPHLANQRSHDWSPGAGFVNLATQPRGGCDRSRRPGKVASQPPGEWWARCRWPSTRPIARWPGRGRHGAGVVHAALGSGPARCTGRGKSRATTRPIARWPGRAAAGDAAEPRGAPPAWAGWRADVARRPTVSPRRSGRAGSQSA